MPGRSLSFQLASATPEVARALLERAIADYQTGKVSEGGYLIHGDEPGSGCAMVYLWPEETKR